MKDSTRIAIKYSFGAVMILLGAMFQLIGLGNKSFLGFDSVPIYMMYVGFLSLIVITISSFFKRKQVVDERMIAISDKANRIVFISIIVIGFAVMVIDGIKPITMPYSLSMSYLVCGIMFIRVVSYRILLKFN